MIEWEMWMSSCDTKLKVCISICCKSASNIQESEQSIPGTDKSTNGSDKLSVSSEKCINTLTKDFSCDLYVETIAACV